MRALLRLVLPGRSRGARLVALATLLGVLLASGIAGAEDKRPAPDYGRPAEGTDAWDVLAWPVRIVLFPLFLINEFILRRPLGALVTAAERGEWIEKLEDFFTFGPRKEITIYPSALFDFGLKPSVGFNATWKYLGHEDNTVKIHFGTWGPDWIALTLKDEFALSKYEKLSLHGALWRRRDNPFSGLGPRSRQDDRVRYGVTTVEVSPGYTLDFGTSSSFEARAGGRSLAFFDNGCCGEPSLREAIDTGRLVAPGYGRGYAGAFQRARFAFDTRRARPAPGSGVRVSAHEETMFPLDAPGGEARRSWIRYGGSVTGSLDVTGTNRVLSLSLDAELLDKLSPGTIPFTDRVNIGGDVLMPGYLRHRLVGDSAVVATLEYTWPIWVYLDGIAHAALGNVYGRHFDGFDVKAARLSTGIGVRSNGDRASGFEALFAIGSDPLDEGFAVSSFRLLVGSHHGF